jgi:hypothetical protein
MKQKNVLQNGHQVPMDRAIRIQKINQASQKAVASIQ